MGEDKSGTEHKRHKTEHKKHRKNQLMKVFLVHLVLLVFRSRFIGQSHQLQTTGFSVSVSS